MEDIIYESNQLKLGLITINEFRQRLASRISRMSEDDLWAICLCHNCVEDEDQRQAELLADQRIAEMQAELNRRKN